MSQELSQVILQAVGKTHEKYGAEHTENAIYKALMEGDVSWFTRGDNSPRSFFEEYVNRGGIEGKKAFLEGILECYLSSVEKINEFEVPMARVLTENVRKIFGEGDGYPTASIYEIVSKIGTCYDKEKSPTDVGFKLANVKLRSGNMQQLKDNMITGLTFAKEGELHLGNMHACTSVGKKRANQQDAVLIKRHSENEAFKFLVVSDGMGGGVSGEKVSDLTIREVSKWFDELPAEYYKNPELASENLSEHLKKISTTVAEKYHGNAGATFVGALVCENETVVVNVGDSRAYTYDKKKNQLIQRSKDHSYVEELYKAGFIKSRDDMRFHLRANSITQYIGMSDKMVDLKFTPYVTRVPNKDYNVLLLFSDGVTDFMSDEDILVVTQNTKKRELAKRMIEVAMDNVSTPREELSDEYYRRERVGGGDNLSAVVLNKPRKKKSNERGESR